MQMGGLAGRKMRCCAGTVDLSELNCILIGQVFADLYLERKISNEAAAIFRKRISSFGSSAALKA